MHTLKARVREALNRGFIGAFSEKTPFPPCSASSQAPAPSLSLYNPAIHCDLLGVITQSIKATSVFNSEPSGHVVRQLDI